MKTFIFIQAAIPHNLKDPHSKALEPDGLSSLFAIAAQSPRREGKSEGLGSNYLFPKTMASNAIRTKTPFLTCLK